MKPRKRGAITSPDRPDRGASVRPRAEVLRVSTFSTALATAAEAIGVPGLHPHEPRHTAASLAIAAGAGVKVVQQMLGHASATMTMDRARSVLKSQ